MIRHGNKLGFGYLNILYTKGDMSSEVSTIQIAPRPPHYILLQT